MIVKNEEKVLEHCLKKVVNYVNEVVIVDTGSTDNTKNIAKKYTDKIYDYEWKNDFADVRNYAISLASNDWILSLDADEIVDKFNINKVNNFIKFKNKIGRIKIVNLMDDKNEKHIAYVGRLFNKKYYKYEGKIHEQLISKDESKLDYEIIDYIEVIHYGYTTEFIIEKDKISRNKNILLDEIKNKPNDSYLYYQLGKTYYLGKDYLEAKKYFEKSISIENNIVFEYVEDLIISYGYTLLKLKQFEDALKLYDYKEYFDYLADYWFLLGLIYMNNAKFSNAIEYFICATNCNIYKNEGTNSYLAFYNIGIIYECLGFIKEAKYYYSLCGDYVLAKNRLNDLIKKF